MEHPSGGSLVPQRAAQSVQVGGPPPCRRRRARAPGALSTSREARCRSRCRAIEGANARTSVSRRASLQASPHPASRRERRSQPQRLASNESLMSLSAECWKLGACAEPVVYYAPESWRYRGRTDALCMDRIDEISNPSHVCWAIHTQENARAWRDSNEPQAAITRRDGLNHVEATGKPPAPSPPVLQEAERAASREVHRPTISVLLDLFGRLAEYEHGPTLTQVASNMQARQRTGQRPSLRPRKRLFTTALYVRRNPKDFLLEELRESISVNRQALRLVSCA